MPVHTWHNEQDERGAVLAAEYDERAKKRSGRIAVKQAEEEERRRRREAELEAAAAIAAAAREKREATQLERWRWMLLPPRLRSKDVPQGMDPRGSDARVRLLARESADERAAREKIETPRGEDAIGRYVLTYWDDDESGAEAGVEVPAVISLSDSDDGQ